MAYGYNRAHALPLDFWSTKISQYRFTYIMHALLILADNIVLSLTWIKTFGIWKNAYRLHMRVSLTTCLLCDETIYFMALLATNVAEMMINHNFTMVQQRPNSMGAATRA
ncbi:uncharacterized protein PHACADRAFT_189312 [Phanerochaete carnosa HHB-10118-sp]|uniref:Uncharacterized protein n=1 Tax=Phanerochaete carnosa (strain HHB-10118-sp) TaxID=650164 RepID=K5WLX0_PHACS|nr:uncharacterized protein PHACADRAFT_189312 [Phanerochaete carnosa HHB-10118-sp]EKM60184.1 hypothetical protein PHACADRAFT_189312 [Phanerochaete carnosa HHB-10118-sp]